MSETPEAACFGGPGQRIPASTPVSPRRLQTWRAHASRHSTRMPSRLRTPAADCQQTVRETTQNVQSKLRALAGIAMIVSLVAVGTAAAGSADATERHRGVERPADGSGGSDRGVYATVVGSERDQTLRPASASPTTGLEHVDLFGDSLGFQADPYLDMFLVQTHNYTLSNYTYGGTATCDWLSRMAVAAAGRPHAALLVFSGNAFTPCMDGVTPRSPRYYDLYTAYTKQAIGLFSAVGAHVFLVGTPVDRSSVAGWDHLDDIYRQLAEANPLAVTFVDAGASVETNTGGFTWTLPCLSIEPSCGSDGTNVVRSPDGIHFCPNGTPANRGVTGPCDEYSPGAFRFALAMVSAVTQYAYSTPVYK
jgi:hypothetical protein